MTYTANEVDLEESRQLALISAGFNRLMLSEGIGGTGSSDILRTDANTMHEFVIYDLVYAFKVNRLNDIVIDRIKEEGLNSVFLKAIHKPGVFEIDDIVSPRYTIYTSSGDDLRTIILYKDMRCKVVDTAGAFICVENLTTGTKTNYITEEAFSHCAGEDMNSIADLIKKYGGHEFNSILLPEQSFNVNEVVYDLYSTDMYKIRQIISSTSVMAAPHQVGYISRDNEPGSLFNKDRFRKTYLEVATKDAYGSNLRIYDRVTVLDDKIDDVMAYNGYHKPLQVEENAKEKTALYYFYRRLLGKGPLYICNIEGGGYILNVTIDSTYDLKAFANITDTVLKIPTIHCAFCKEEPTKLTKKEKRELKRLEEEQEKAKKEKEEKEKEEEDLKGGPYDLSMWKDKIVRTNRKIGSIEAGSFGVVINTNEELGRISVEFNTGRKSSTSYYFRKNSGQLEYFEIHSDLIVSDEELTNA